MSSTIVIVGQNMPDRTSDRLTSMHDRSFIFEPLPECAARCRERYAGNKSVAVIDAACGSSFGCVDFHVYNQDGLSSSIGSVTEQAKSLYSTVDLSSRETIQVSMVNLYSFLWQRGVEFVDALIIDAQGMDLTILKTMQPMITASKVGFIQCEADGLGVQLYDLPNAEADFVAFMADYPQYTMGKVEGRVAFNPDLYWELRSE